MVKKLFSILLLLIYLPAVSGISADSFYCCGELSSVHFHLGQKMSADEEMNGAGFQHAGLNCCAHIVHTFQIQDAQQQGKAELTPLAPFSLSTVAAQMPDLFVPHLSDKLSNSNAYLRYSPPIVANQPLFVRNESFLI